MFRKDKSAFNGEWESPNRGYMLKLGDYTKKQKKAVKGNERGPKTKTK